MAKGKLSLRVHKRTRFRDGIEAAFTDLTPLSGQGRRRQEMVPISEYEHVIKQLDVPAGDWLVEARLPSGEVISSRVAVGEARDVTEVLNAAPSSQEEYSWATSFSRVAAIFDAARPQGHLAQTRGVGFESSAGAFADAQTHLATDPFDLLLWDTADPAGRLRESDEWARVGRLPPNPDFDASSYSLPPSTRSFIRMRGTRHALALPLPWPGEETTVVQVQAVPEIEDDPSELTLRAWVLDPGCAAVIAFLESSDVEAAQMLAPQTAAWAERMLFAKQRNPLAAAAGALALVRLRRYDLLHDWPLNLANWFPWLPDGAMIAAWCVLRLGTGQANKEAPPRERARAALPLIFDAARRGAPFFSGSVALLHEVCQLVPPSQELTPVVEWSKRLFQSVKGQGFVAAYEAGPKDSLENLLTALAKPPPAQRG